MEGSKYELEQVVLVLNGTNRKLCFEQATGLGKKRASALYSGYERERTEERMDGWEAQEQREISHCGGC